MRLIYKQQTRGRDQSEAYEAEAISDTGCTPHSYLLNIKLHLRTFLARVLAVPKLDIPAGVSRSASTSLTGRSQPGSAETLIQKNQPAPRPTCVLDRAT